MSLVINDAHIEAVKQYIVEQSKSLDNIVSQYIKTMNAVIEMGIMEGATAEALKEFLVQVKADVGSNSAMSERIGSEAEIYCMNFIENVTKAGKELY